MDHTVSLQHVPSEFRSEFTVESDGSVTASQRAIARLAGVSDIAVSKLLKRVVSGANLGGSKAFESLTAKGIEGANLSDIKASLVIEYYAFDAGRYCTDQARQVYRAFGAIGFRTWVQGELGWKPGQPSTTHTKARLEGKNARRTLTDSIKDYIGRHPELSDNSVKFMYSNVTDALYLNTHGKRARKLVEALDCGKNELRDRMSGDELMVLSSIEQIAMRLIEGRLLIPEKD